MPEELIPEQEIAYEATVPMTSANLMAFLMVPLAFLLFWLPYWVVWQNWPLPPFWITLLVALAP